MDSVVRPISVAGRGIGPGYPCFVVAEAGVNHNGEPEKTFRLVDAAVRAGADAVKFQTFTAEQLATRDAPKAGYQAEVTGSGESQFEMLRRLELSAARHLAERPLRRLARRLLGRDARRAEAVRR